MSILTGFKSAPFSLFSTTSSATSPVNSDAGLTTLVGSKWTSGDGREFVLVLNGAAALAAGTLVQTPAAVSNSAGLSPATSSTTGYSSSYPIAATIGGNQIQIATGSTAFLANEFAGGLLYTVEGTGLGQTLKIASNTAASTTSACVLTLEDTFSTATSTDTRFTLVLNPYGSSNGTAITTHGVIVTPATTLTGEPIGAVLYPIPASTSTVPSFGLIQTKGPIALLGSDTCALGADVGCPVSGTAGATVTYAVATGPRIGNQMVVAASGKYNLVNLQL